MTVSTEIISEHIYIYRFRIPRFVKKLFRNFSDEVKDQDEKHDEWTDDSP